MVIFPEKERKIGDSIWKEGFVSRTMCVTCGERELAGKTGRIGRSRILGRINPSNRG